MSTETIGREPMVTNWVNRTKCSLEELQKLVEELQRRLSVISSPPSNKEKSVPKEMLAELPAVIHEIRCINDTIQTITKKIKEMLDCLEI
jgi:polyhydroxyalkanoate synthesis regulator phasin